MIVTLEETKQYLRVDGDHDDTLIESLINAAEEYLVNATGNTFTESSLAKLLCWVLITDWYENREHVGKVNVKVRPIIESMLAQLKYAYPMIETAALPDATVGVAYEATLSATGGVAPYTWGITVGALPDGLTLDERTGVVSGTPTAAGQTTLTVQLTDSSPTPKVVSRPVSMVVGT